jgi:hypothetical protein
MEMQLQECRRMRLFRWMMTEEMFKVTDVFLQNQHDSVCFEVDTFLFYMDFNIPAHGSSNEGY